MAIAMATARPLRLFARLAIRARAFARGRRWTLRSKGWAALFLLTVFEAALWVHWTRERARLQEIVQQLEANHVRMELVTEVNMGLVHSAIALHQAIANDQVRAQSDAILLDLHVFLPRLPELSRFYPELAPSLHQIARRVKALEGPDLRDEALALRDAEFELSAGLDERANAGEQQGRRMLQEYNELQQRVAMFLTVMNIAALIAIGAGITIFFTRLARDLTTLEEQAAAVIGGYRGAIRPLRRRDEVGALMNAIQRMQLQLRHREQRQEFSRQQKFHQEKMAAVGSVAAAVAHEIGNPLDAIAGIAQHSLEELTSGERPDADTLVANARLTLAQAERISQIVRQISDLGSPRSPDPELFDANELVRSTCSFLRYDKRLRPVDLQAEVDPSLPAVHAVPDHLTQVLMNLLINAADALDEVQGRRRTIRVTTRAESGAFVLTVWDNGHGMTPEVLGKAFEESFTTKPAGKGRGIGLSLCRALVESAGGTIDLESVPGQGTTAVVRLPLGGATVSGPGEGAEGEIPAPETGRLE
jgi:two-component system NtrC family sensor kinase